MKCGFVLMVFWFLFSFVVLSNFFIFFLLIFFYVSLLLLYVCSMPGFVYLHLRVLGPCLT